MRGLAGSGLGLRAGSTGLKASSSEGKKESPSSSLEQIALNLAMRLELGSMTDAAWTATQKDVKV